MSVFKQLWPGDPAPWFMQKSTSSEQYHFDTVGGRYVLMCFFLSARDVHGEHMLSITRHYRALFDDNRISFFGVSIDPDDLSSQRVQESLPGIRHFWDFDGTIGKLYGAMADGPLNGRLEAKPFWLLLDPALRVMAKIDRKQDGRDVQEVVSLLSNLPAIDAYLGFSQQAPVLFIPNVFEHSLCQHLIQLYEHHGGEDSGFMREVNGKTTGMRDYSHKRRSDCLVEDDALIKAIQIRFTRRIVPEILKVHYFNANRMERYLVGCYRSETGDHFRPHRDNTSKGTAYRRFAVSINLNHEFTGGELSFPEYGHRSYKMAPGMAAVFSCSLLHTVSPVTSGRRYVFLPFLYDDAAATLRAQSNEYLGDDVAKYYQASSQ